MNKRLLAVFIILGALFSVHDLHAQKTGYQIIVQVPTLKDSTCFLARYYGDKQYLIDTVKSDHTGTAVFSGREKLAGGLYLFVFPTRDILK